MRLFFDTSVLVAGCVRRHPHFPRARPLLQSVVAGTEGVISCHSLGWGLIECAREAGCDLLYTFDLGDFRRLAPDLAERIAAP